MLGIVPLAEHNFYTSLVLIGLAEGGAPEAAGPAPAAGGGQPGAAARSGPRAAGTTSRTSTCWSRPSWPASRAATTTPPACTTRPSRPPAGAAFSQDEALGNELAGRFFRARARKRIARLYLRAAVDGYARWGASAKAAALEEEHPDLVEAELGEVGHLAGSVRAGGAGQALDLLGLLKAAETISSEVVFDRLLEKLLAVCFEVAGATRGALALDEDGNLVVQAAGAVGEPVSLVHTPLRRLTACPAPWSQHAHRSEDPIVLGSAARGSPVPDPYIEPHHTKSVLLVPIRRQARAIGVLYLENHLVEHAFTPDRVRVLQLLSSQIAISVENARLYERAQDSIRQREEFLSVASHELQTPLAALQLAVQGLLHGAQPRQQASASSGRWRWPPARPSACRPSSTSCSTCRASAPATSRCTSSRSICRWWCARSATASSPSSKRPAAWCASACPAPPRALGSPAARAGGHQPAVQRRQVRARPPHRPGGARRGREPTSLMVTDRGVGIPAQRMPGPVPPLRTGRNRARLRRPRARASTSPRRS